MLLHQRRLCYRATILFSLALSLASWGLLNSFTPSISQAATTSGVAYAWGSNTNGKLGNGSTTNSSTPVSITLATGVTASAITGGSEFSLAIGSDNKLYTWGYNADGELGNGNTNTGPTVPTAITLASGVTPTAISAGQYHSLAIGSDNKVYAWGYNGNGQLGDNSTTTRTSPVAYTLAAGVTPIAIKAGFDHSLAIGSDNKLYAWGNNASGQLGDTTTTQRITPKAITLATGVTPTAIAAAQGWSMAIGSDGKLYTWGNNTFGQLGNNTTSSNPGPNPTAITLATGVTPTAIAATGFHALAIGSDGKLYTWGFNAQGELGNNTLTNSATPTAITLATGVTPTRIISGFYHSLAVGSDGKLYTWGRNDNGQLGDGTTTNRSIPAAITVAGGLTPLVIGAGYLHSFAIVPVTLSINSVTKTEGNSGTTNFTFTVTLSTALSQSVTVNYATSDLTATAGSDYTATSGSLLFLAGGTNATITVPVNGDTTLEPNETFLVKLSNPSSGVSLGVSQGVGTIVNDDGGAVYGWGDNSAGLMGNGTTGSSSNPTVASLPTAITALAAGTNHALAIGTDDQLYAWGSNSNGQLGNGTTTNSSSPIVVTLASGVSPVAIAASYNQSYAIGSDGKLYAWGMNNSGQLGNGTTTDSTTPLVISLPNGVTPTAIASGVGFAMTIGSDSKLYAWGGNSFGEVGDGTNTPRYTPVAVSLPIGITPAVIAAGSYQSLMIGSDGNLYSWGHNDSGQLGIGTTTDNSNPTKVTLAAGVTPVRLAGGDYHSLAIGSDGKVYSWGLNDSGQLGNNTLTNSSTPVSVTVAAGVTAVGLGAGWDHSLAIGSNGKLYTWGYNGFRQLGNGSTTNSSTPIVASLLTGPVPVMVTGASNSSLALVPAPGLSIGNVSHLEGNSGNTSFSFPITLNYASSQTITLSYATSNGTATAGTDYTATSGTLTFAPGTTSTTIAVTAKGDTTVEPNETFFVNLSNVTNATATNSQGIGTIFNDDYTSSGPIYSWGSNQYGQLGDTTTTDKLSPVLTRLPNGVVATRIASGNNHNLAIGSDGKLYVWGLNDKGQLGDGSNTNRSTPVSITLATGVTPLAIATGYDFSVAIGSDNKLYGWGNNYYGQIGTGAGATQSTPVTITLASGVTPVAIAAGFGQILAVGSDGKLYGLGYNSHGQFCDNTSTDKTTPVTAKLPSGVVPLAIAEGGYHTLIIGSDNNLYSCGYNGSGQLGIGSITDKSTPQLVTLASGITPTAIAAGQYQSLAIGSDGKLYDWGGNDNGQLGDGSQTSKSTPQLVTLASGVTPTVLSAGNLYSLAIGSDGKFYDWGANGSGQLGDGTTTQRTSPAATSLPGGVTPTALIGGSLHTLAILPAPSLSIGNVSQAEGNSGTTNFSFPVTLTYASSQTITVNYATSNGTATAGSDYTATSGTLTFAPGATTLTVTVAVKGDTVVEPDETFKVTLSSPSGATLATSQATGTILNDDTPAISINNVSQAEGNSGTTSFSFNVTLSAASYQTVTVNYATSDGTATAGSDYVAASGTLSFAPGTTSQTISVTVNGDTAYEPDETFFVNLSSPSGGATLATSQGTGTILNDDSPTLSISNVLQAEGNSGTTNFVFTVTLAPAYTQTVTVYYATSDDTARSGSDYTTTTGTLTFSPGITTQTLSVAVNGDTTLEPNETFLVKLFNPTGGASLAVPQGVGTIVNDDGGVVYAAGSNLYGQFGNGNTSSVNTTTVPSVLPVAMTAIAAGDYHTLAIGTDGKLYAWGYNNYGQLGDGTTTQRTSPVVITLANGVSPVAISAGQYDSFAIGSDGKLYAWGYNISGQLGDGTTTNRSSPVVINLLSGVTPTAVAAGSTHTLAIGSDGNLYSWGYNATGAVGDGTTTNRLSPVLITLATGVAPRAISVGGNHNLAIGSDNNLYAWGDNSNGALGDGTTTNRPSPIVVNLATGVVPNQIAAGTYHSLAIGSDGNPYSWGFNFAGQLCNGTNSDSSTPIAFTLADGVIPVGLGANAFNSLAIGSDGNLYQCGANDAGQLGNGSTTNSFTPVLTNLPGGATPILGTVGVAHTMVLMPSPTLSIGNVSLAEGNTGTTSFSFPVTLTYASSQTVTVSYSTSDGTATAGSDYTATSGTLTFAPGTTTGTIIVPVVGDTAVEPDETFTVTLSNPSGATLTTSQATGTILNDDSTAISIGSVSHFEGNSGTTNFTFPVTLTNVSLQPVTVNYATSDSTATAGSDYTATSGTLNFPPGTTNQSITVSVNGDTTYEGDETFFVTLSNPNGATLAVSQATGTILNDDLQSSTLSLTSSPNPASFGQSVTFTATVSPATATGTVTFNFDSTTLVTATLDANGVATYVTSTLSLGQHHLVATYNGDTNLTGSSSAPLTQTITAGAAGQVISISGSGQSATVNSAFAAPLVAKVVDSGANPVSGASVTFTAPASGASGTFADSGASYTGTTDGSGLVTSTVFTANATAGAYTVAATVSGVGSPANFSLTNTAGTASGLTIVSGNNQQTVISTAFASPLVAKVMDGSGNAVSGVQVTFTAPTSGASARFAGSTVYTSTTDSSGLVTSTVPTANVTAGSYTVSAAIVPGTFPARSLRAGATPKVTNVQYQLTNLAGVAATISAVSGSGQSATINTAFGNRLIAKVVDSGSNPVSGASVTFAAPAGGASGTFAGGSATYIGTTDSSGLITTTVLTANGTTGTFTVIATVSGVVSPATFSLTNVSGCNPLVVTSALDNSSCGTLRAALVAASTGSTKTVTINLTTGSVISLTTGLTLTSGVSITTTASCGSAANNTMVPPITLQGVGASSGNGLTLAGNNSLYGLWVRGFSGVQIKAPVGSSTKMQCVKASKL